MRSRGTILVWAIMALAGGWQGVALAGGPAQNPYQAILERNVFGLRTPPPPPPPKPPPPPPKIYLTGITTILGDKLALMEAMSVPKPGQPSREIPLMLAEGQRQDQIQVLKIDTKARKVEVNDRGTRVTLTFDKNSPPNAFRGRNLLPRRPGLLLPRFRYPSRYVYRPPPNPPSYFHRPI